jgi:hypothetical protein
MFCIGLIRFFEGLYGEDMERIGRGGLKVSYTVVLDI